MLHVAQQIEMQRTGVGRLHLARTQTLEMGQRSVILALPEGLFFVSEHTLIFLRHCWLGLAIFIIGLMVGAARVYLGVHYPGDILGGLLLGVVSAMASLWIWARWGDQLYRLASTVWKHVPRPLKQLLRTTEAAEFAKTRVN